MKNKRHLRISFLTAFLFGIITCSLYSQNIKVFIMAGQSNMIGNGDIMPANLDGTLTHFVNNTTTSEFDYVQDADGNWSTRNDVWVTFDNEDSGLLTGMLDIGFGATQDQIGPEFGFGHQLGQQTNDKILIIKTCWGGTSLANDFRPPSSGGTTGNAYNQMISDINAAMDNIASEFPEYSGESLEIAGMAWFQGWNDGEEQTYLDEYEQNLINLITDVRADLNVPDLPFVIGLTGNGGLVLEQAPSYVNDLQTQLVPAQMRAANYTGHENVSYVDTREFWRDGNLSPEPDFLHHWHNNAESYLRIGDAFGKKMNEMLGQSNTGNTQVSMGYIQPNTNPVLPASYNFMEYVFGEPNDQGVCQGIQNSSATINTIFISQTHRHAIGHPFLFTIGERPALLQLALFGTGNSPDVQVEGILDGTSLGILCLNGPDSLSTNVNLDQPNFDDYFSVTLPKAWIKIGLELNITLAGGDSRTLTQEDLRITPYTELNLVNVDMDLMDYNHLPHRSPIFDDFLEELASAVPVSKVRFGYFPGTVKMPTVAANSWQGVPYVASLISDLEDIDIDGGNLNSAAHSVLGKIQQATGDFPNTIYFGNTLNLEAGGWGVDGNFVSYEYTDVFIHELGHAFSLLHWEQEYELPNPEPDQHNYPYSGETGSAGGRGEAWNFIQDSYEFVSPYCQNSSTGVLGEERSDCMQREHPCVETRPSGPGPWDGYGDFTVKAISNYLLGSDVTTGQVEYKGSMVDYQLKDNPGYPRVTLENGKRAFTRAPSQPQNTFIEDLIKLPGTEVLETEVFMISGSAHVNDMSFNVIYEPIQYKGTLLPTIDPTDPIMFATLQNIDANDARELYDQERDLTLKLTYIDGTVNHVLVPFHSSDRVNSDEPNEPVRIEYFSVVVPGDQPLCKVEMYRRAFLIGDEFNDTPGNINDPEQNITAANFMDNAILMSTLDYSCNCPGTPDYIEPGTPCDDGNPFTTNDVEDGFCNCEGVPIEPCGFITNGQFEESLFNWWTWGSDASSTNGEATFENINFVDAGLATGALSLEEGERYTLKFDAYASEPRFMNVLIFLNEEPFTTHLAELVNLGTTKQEYEISFEFDAPSITNGALEFFLGNGEGNIFLDNICLDVECDPIVNPDCDQVLSVSYTSFDAELIDESVRLSWTATDEINLSHYVIERSSQFNANRFLEIGDVPAENLGEYSQIDRRPYKGINYYRLKFVDWDGTINYSEIIALNFGESNDASDSIIIFPNPATERINITAGSLIQIVDIKGTLYPPSLDVSILPSGMYIAQVLLESGEVIAKKFVKE